jgi:hypothetical protein
MTGRNGVETRWDEMTRCQGTCVVICHLHWVIPGCLVCAHDHVRSFADVHVQRSNHQRTHWHSIWARKEEKQLLGVSEDWRLKAAVQIDFDTYQEQSASCHVQLN